MPRMKQDVHMWLPRDLIEALHKRSRTQEKPLNLLVEGLLRKGLAEDDARRMERSALPIMRQALGEDQAAALEVFRQQIRADVQEITQKHIDRLAKLLVRSARATSLTWRLIYRLIQRQYGPAVAQTWYEEEYAKAGKAMASHVNSGKEIEQ